MIFGWGKIKQKAVVDLFGEEEELARKIPLPMPASPAIPNVKVDAIPIDFEKAMEPVVRLPPIDFAPILAELPTAVPRAWSPRSGGQDASFAKPGETSYLELAGVDAKEALELFERLADPNKGWG